MGSSGSRFQTVVRHAVLRAAIAAAAVFPGLLHAYSVGEPQLISRFAQPLRVQVPITLGVSEQVGDASELSARLLPLAAYEDLGLQSPALQPQAVQIRVHGEAPLYMVEISSSQIVREPFLTLVLEVRLRGVRVLRELPLLFELPASKPVAPAIAVPAPAAATVTVPVAVPAQAVIEPLLASEPLLAAAAPSSAATFSTETAVPALRATESPRASSRRQKPLRLQSLQLSPAPVIVSPSDTTMSTAGSEPLARFQLSTRFDSYAQLKAAGQEPAVATSAGAPLPVPQPVARPVVAAATRPVSEAEPAASGVLGLLLAFAAGVAVTLLAMRWRNRRRPAPLPAQPAAARPKPAAARQEAKAPPVEAAAAAMIASSAPRETLPVMASVPSPVTPAESGSVAPDSPSAAELEAIRRRIGELRQGNNDLNLARKLQLVEAYLDLHRPESASSLLAELEAGLPKATRPTFTLIKG